MTALDPDTVGCRTPMCDRPAVVHVHGPTAGPSPRITIVAGHRAQTLTAPQAVTAGSAACMECALRAVEGLAP